MSKDLRGEYFDWLSSISLGSRASKYEFLMSKLVRTEFYSILPMDENREGDGKELRVIFLDQRGTAPSFSLECLSEVIEGPCSVLEMIVGVAVRMHEALEDSRYRSSVEACVWKLLENLDITYWDDQNWVSFDGDYEVDMKLRVFLERRYSNKGRGGLFPLKNSRKNQRNVEIWYQMQEFLIENNSELI